VGSIAWEPEIAGVYDATYAGLELMAPLAGFQLQERWGGWDRSRFTSESTSQVAVFEKCLRKRHRL
jgi:hypothetical protein